MSTDASESRDSHGSVILHVDKKKSAKPPFNLYFAKCQPMGRSDFRISKLDGVIKFIEKYVTPKFYSRDADAQERNSELSKEIIERIKADNDIKNFRNVNRIPPLSSQSYGWWYDRYTHSKDSRFNFHRNTSDMVHFNAMIQWEDKKLQSCEK